MAKWMKADPKAWPLGYTGSDGVDTVSIPAGGAALVSDSKAAQLAADFPGTFAEVGEKEATSANVAVAPKEVAEEPGPARGLKPIGKRG